ncbi:hypothetical protein ACWD11_03070 [Streptomyces sp. NPDC002776]
MQHHTMIPPVSLGTNGHLPFVVQAAEDTRARTVQVAAETAREHPEHRPCPDGIDWCTGTPEDHADPREHHHTSRQYQFNGRYLQDADGHGIAAVQLSSWDDEEPRISFQGTGLWPDLGLPETDELLSDAVLWVIGLLALRRRFAIALEPGKTPFTETESEQTSAAAFSLAARAIEVALAQSPDRAGTLAAMRSLLNLHADEDCG